MDRKRLARKRINIVVSEKGYHVFARAMRSAIDTMRLQINGKTVERKSTEVSLL